jgi:hypothetical protein
MTDTGHEVKNMQDEHWAQDFLADKALAEARRQQAIDDAHDRHLQAVAALWEQQAAEPRKGDWDPQYHRQMRELKALDDALDAEVRRADETYHEEVARIGQEHGVRVR